MRLEGNGPAGVKTVSSKLGKVLERLERIEGFKKHHAKGQK